MSLNVALEFASRGYAVLPVGPNKRPWTEHGVHSATTNPLSSPVGTGPALLAR